MKVLFIGGTGNISTYCVELALARGHQVTLLNRGREGARFSQPVETIHGDRHDRGLLRRVAEQGRFDVACDFIGYTPEEAADDVAAFTGQVGQLVYVSSVAAYQKPPRHYVHTESTPLKNPFWKYAQDKIASEEIFLRAYREQGFPVTIVRPWHTYGETRVPTATMGAGYTAVDRARNGRPLLVHGDGQSLWGLTFSGDFALGFVGLFGREAALGEAVHITTEEILTWDQIYRTLARVAGGPEPELVHLPSEIIHRLDPELGTPLLGDLAYSAVYDDSKIKRLVPGYHARTTWAEGVAKSIAWYDANPRRQVADTALDARIDRLVEVAKKVGGRT